MLEVQNDEKLLCSCLTPFVSRGGWGEGKFWGGLLRIFWMALKALTGRGVLAMLASDATIR